MDSTSTGAASLRLVSPLAGTETRCCREYPKDAHQAQHYVDLLKALREGLDRHAVSKGLSVAQGYELTIAAVSRTSYLPLTLADAFLKPCGPDHYSKLMLKEMDRYLSFWNLMACAFPPLPLPSLTPAHRYDYAGSWDPTTNHQAALLDNGSPNAISTDRAVKYYTSHGVDPSKLIIGPSSLSSPLPH